MAVSAVDTAQATQWTAASGSARGRGRTDVTALYTFYNKYVYSALGNDYVIMGGVWDRDALEAYAADYYAATGRTLDVDALMAEYADSRGIIGYGGQIRMYEDDALGLSHITDSIRRADDRLANTGKKPEVDWDALDSFVKQYTYGTRNMYAKIDRNGDGVWSLEEIQAYAAAYEKATGLRLDAEALFAKYDTDLNGFLTYSELNRMHRDDAFGLGVVKDLLASRPGAEEAPPPPEVPDRLGDLLGTMWRDNTELRAMIPVYTKAMQQSALLHTFMAVNSMIRYSFVGGYGYGRALTWQAFGFHLMDRYG